VSQEHQHLTTEQLSACIDKQLSVEEQSLVDEHLKQCEQCQLWLKELRSTVRLLHALPQPQLPRSFTLPADVLVAPLPAQTEQASRVTPIRRTRPSRMWVAISSISALAAVVGIVFIVSGFLSFSHLAASSAPAIPASGSSASSTNSGVDKQAPLAKQAATPYEMSTAMATSLSQATANFAAQATATAVAVPKMQPEHAQNSPSSTGPPVSLFDLSQSAGRVDIGMLLLILGCAGFVYLRLKSS
jgi:anti-sigma factor RsiW